MRRLILFAPLLFTRILFADYIPTDLCDLISQANLCAYGTITEVNKHFFVFKPLNVVCADSLSVSYNIEKFENWTCAQRVVSYQRGQRLILFGTRCTNKYEKFQYKIMGAADEGELIEDDTCVAYNGKKYNTADFIKALKDCHTNLKKLTTQLRDSSLSSDVSYFESKHPINREFVQCLKTDVGRSSEAERFETGQGNQFAVVSNDAYNLVYCGIENNLSVAVPGIKPDEIEVSVNQGTIRGGKGKYVAIPAVPGEFRVVVRFPCGDSICTVSHFFSSIKIPEPSIFINGKSGGVIKSYELKFLKYVSAKTEHNQYDLKYKVNKFALRIKNENYLVSGNGSFTYEMRDLLSALKSGDQFEITDIEVIGSDNSKYYPSARHYTVE